MQTMRAEVPLLEESLCGENLNVCRRDDVSKMAAIPQFGIFSSADVSVKMSHFDFPIR